MRVWQLSLEVTCPILDKMERFDKRMTRLKKIQKLGYSSASATSRPGNAQNMIERLGSLEYHTLVKLESTPVKLEIGLLKSEILSDCSLD